MSNTNAVIYARYSSAGQREESIEGQLRECRQYAARKGLTIVAEYSDRALSATTDKRPEFQRMIHDAEKRGFAVVICWKHDRFARNRYDAALYKARLKSCGVSLAYAMEDVPEGPEGIIIESVMEGYAEYYSANLSQNVKRGLYESALKRQTMGVRLLGYTEGPDKRYALDAETAPIIRRIFEEYAAGRGPKEICEDLNAEGFRTLYGRKFKYDSIFQTIRNPKYKGLYVYDDIIDEHGIPAIVDADLWARANAVADKRRKAPNLKADEYILSGKLFCGHCGASMTAGSGTSRNGAVHRYYTCNGRRKHNGCRKDNVPKDLIEDRIVGILADVAGSDAIIQTFADRFLLWQAKQRNKGPRPGLEQRIRENKKASENISKVIEGGFVSVTLTERLRALEAERDELELALAHASLDEPELSRDEVVFFLESFRDGDREDKAWRAYLVQTFLNRAYLFDDGRLMLHLNYSGDCNEVTVDLIREAETKGDVFDFGARSPATARELEHLAVIFFAGNLFVTARK